MTAPRRPVALHAAAWPLLIVLCAALLAALLSTASALPARADVDDFTFSSMHADYELSRDADGTSRLHVVETFVAKFPDADQNRGMRRSIPETYDGQPLNINLQSVTDENGDTWPVETDSDDGVLTITARGDAYLHGKHTFVFTYDLEHVTRYFSDTEDDEFYWDVNGDGWAQPFGEVSMTLTVPADLASSLTGEASCYQGDYGATEACGIESSDAGGARVFTAKATSLGEYSTMTVAVGFAAHTFTPFDNSFGASGMAPVEGVVGLLGLGSLAGVFWARRTALRDAPGRGVIVPEYEPPAQIDAARGAILMNKPAAIFPAEVLELAVVGAIRMVEREKKGLFGGTALTLELVDASRADENGQWLLGVLFGKELTPGSKRKLKHEDDALAEYVGRFQEATRKELKKMGLYRSVPGKARWLPRLGALTMVALSFVVTMIMGAGGYNTGVAVVANGVAVALAVLVFALTYRRPVSEEGRRLRDALEGLKMFMEWAEADRIRMLQSPRGAERAPVSGDDQDGQVLRIYERLLPYAVILGIEKEWAERLQVLYSARGDEPTWYAGAHGFTVGALMSNMSSSLSPTSSSSSSSGGSGGGGFAGGGGGGGGGGGA